MRGNQAARQQFVVERGFGGDDDDKLGDVRGDEFFAVRNGAVEQGFARQDILDYRMAIGSVLQFDEIPARHLAFFPARDAFKPSAVGQFRQVVAAKRGDDLSLLGWLQWAVWIFKS